MTVRPSVVGVVVPAHDEEAEIAGCLDALTVAAAHPDVAGLDVRVLVVLDDCRDQTAARCAERAVATVVTRFRDVGRARARGVASLLADLVLEPHRRMPAVWIASTDADSRVAPDWLAAQLRLHAAGADVVLGVVDVPSPTPAFRARYIDAHGPGPHPHVHGACLGLTLPAYLAVGGFRPRQVGEDQDLADRLEAHGELQVVRSTAVRVLTSDRRVSRVRGGFADVLSELDRQAAATG